MGFVVERLKTRVLEVPELVQDVARNVNSAVFSRISSGLFP
jgi:hypothetical protein